MGLRYRWQDPIDDPSVEIYELGRTPPEVKDPAEVWKYWHERHIACWEELAAKYKWYVEWRDLVCRLHEQALKEMIEDPKRGGRKGYWSHGY